MSKCREELDKWFSANAYGSQKLAARIWQAAWNARGRVDAEICRNGVDRTTPQSVAPVIRIAEAIEQEDERD